ncbi:DUF3618 domain-containing protein [Streptomyces sp. V4-01]|uniref:DUF3618 domain-containing protein n=1 Tax=Actinacidiphila polyblastidii TaxID=3110430 RepID=A0ABU7PK85_9ACTN|nr:DUF3618 domain-containing protein [Streptomyces sp. V4-01]
MSEPSKDPQTTPTPEDLREHVEQTRAELGETVAALSAKTDVTAQAKEKTAQVKEQVAVKASELKAKAKTTAAHAGEVWEEKAPEHVRQKAAEGTQVARDHRTALLAALGAITVALLVWRSRKG